jgi:hypothetical protein
MEKVNQRIGIEPIPRCGLAVHKRADFAFHLLGLRHGVFVKPNE